MSVNTSPFRNLPNGWTALTLDALAPGRSQTVDPRKTPSQNYELYSVPAHAQGVPEIVRGQDVGSSKQMVTSHTVLLCKINPRINRAWIVGDNSEHKKIASTEWIVFPVTPYFLPKYLYYYLQTESLRQYLSANVSGVGGSLMRVKASTLIGYAFPLPPLPEQHRIVAKIEELFTQLDAGVEALKKVQALLKQYRASVLKAACEGKLVPTEAELAKARKLGIRNSKRGKDDPGYEPARVLLARILKERRKKWEEAELAKMKAKGKTSKDDQWKKKYKEPVPPDTTNLPRLPEGWCWANMGTLVSVSRPGLKTGPFGSLLKKHEHRLEGIPVLGIENIRNMRFVPGAKIHITVEKAKQLHKYDAVAGDLLVSRSGTVGEVCVVPDNLGDARISTNVLRISLNSSVLRPAFFCLLFNGSPSVLRQVRELCKGSTRVFLNQTILKATAFPLPPHSEQIRIISEADRRLSIIAELERVVDENMKRAASLRQAILKRAFEGKLVPQDPNDEPAEKLLERIRAEREKAGGLKPKKKRRKKI